MSPKPKATLKELLEKYIQVLETAAEETEDMKRRISALETKLGMRIE